MTLKTAKVLVVIFTVALVACAAYIGMRNLSYFEITDINVSLTGPVFSLPSQMERVIHPLKGLNIFEISVSQLRATLQSFEGVSSVYIKRFYPGKIDITINFTPCTARCYFTEGTDTYYFLSDKYCMSEVGFETFELFDSLVAVELIPEYGFLILKWGVDTGFRQMIELAGILYQNSLISRVKYDNTSSNEFGNMILEFDAISTVLCVQEPVKPERLTEAINMIVRNRSDDAPSRYDLYSNALVKRR